MRYQWYDLAVQHHLGALIMVVGDWSKVQVRFSIEFRFEVRVMLTNHLGGRVEVRLAAPEQLPASVGQLRQEVLRVPPEPDLVRPPLHQTWTVG